MWNKKGGSFIPSSEADDIINRYQKENPDKVRSVHFDADKIKELTANATGVIVYYATNPDGTNTVVLRAVDDAGKAINELNLETGNPCPPYCAQ
jgi:hypothetical protein